MRTKLRTCLRKTQFLTRSGAERFAEPRLLMGQSAYRCNQCKHWHLTSRLPKSRRASGMSAGTAETQSGSGLQPASPTSQSEGTPNPKGDPGPPGVRS
jgi:hypothetical protein